MSAGDKVRKPDEVSFDEFAPSTREEWRAAAEAALKGASFEKRMFTPTYEGITLKPLYTAEDTEGLPSSAELPGGEIGPWEIAQGEDEFKDCLTAPLGNLMEAGGLEKPLDALWDETAAAVHDTASRLLIRSGVVAHNGGASAVQETACAMTEAIETLRAMLERGVSVEDFARHLRFEFSQGANFFMEIAKLRAARRVWSRIAESFGGGREARRTEIFARTSSFTKTVCDPYVNMLRNTTEAFSAVLGGVDGLTVVPFDEPIAAPSEFSRRQARNAQIMLQKEFNLLGSDPVRGSWYLESLTDELAQKIWAELQKIEAQGGFLRSLQDGLIQGDIDAVLQERFKRLSRRSDRAVGTNMYPNVQERIDWKAVREPDVRMPSNPALSVTPVLPRRWTEPFEALRRRTEEHKARTGEGVKIFLANMGPIPQHKARADFITGFMEVAAFDVLKNDGFGTAEDCAAAAQASGALAAVICSTDASYPELVPAVARAIKERAPGMKVYLAGEPAPEFKAGYEEAGVDGFISVRSNCLEVLTELQRMGGVF